MTTHKKLEEVFGSIKKSRWAEEAVDRKQSATWINRSQNLALEVLEILEIKGWSQKYFAAQMGLSPQVVSKWLKGRENFTLETIGKIEKVLNVDLIEIIQRDNYINNQNQKVFSIEKSPYEVSIWGKDSASAYQSKVVHITTTYANTAN